MSDSHNSPPINGIRRLLDLEKLRTRRRTLKGLLVGTGAITGAGMLHAQQEAAQNIVPTVSFLLDDDDQCDPGPTHQIPADSGVTPAEQFTLSASNYTGTASRSIMVSSANLDCPTLVTVTFSMCMEIVSSTSDLAMVSIDPIVITEGLSAIDAMNSDPAVDYYFRGGRPFSDAEDADTNEKRSLMELPIMRESVNTYTAHGSPSPQLLKSCGFAPSTLPFTLNIENNQPVVTILERSVSTNVEYTIPKTRILLSADACAHPDRFATSCNVGEEDDNDDVGIIILTTPDPNATGGPIG